MRTETIIQFDASLDHLTGEEIGMALEALSTHPQILDVVFLTGVGKKNRPVGLLQALCRPEDEIKARDAIFRHTHTLGLRRSLVERYALPREETNASINDQTIPAKQYVLENSVYSRPEADAIKNLANAQNLGAPALRFGAKKINNPRPRKAPRIRARAPRVQRTP